MSSFKSYSDSYSKASKAVDRQVVAIGLYNKTCRDYDTHDNNSFMVGYLSSQMASIIADLPLSRQKEILAGIQETTLMYQEKMDKEGVTA